MGHSRAGALSQSHWHNLSRRRISHPRKLAFTKTYAIDNRSSFDNLTRWLNDVKNFAKKEVIVAIVGNKCDLEAERAVKKEEGLALAKKIDAIFFEASALTNTNVDELFRAIAKALYKKIAEKSAEGQQKKGEEESHPK